MTNRRRDRRGWTDDERTRAKPPRRGRASPRSPVSSLGEGATVHAERRRRGTHRVRTGSDANADTPTRRCFPTLSPTRRDIYTNDLSHLSQPSRPDDGHGVQAGISTNSEHVRMLSNNYNTYSPNNLHTSLRQL
jgi:hypothetical protein